jgi:ABC-type branched-subunit amino acid transport system substrate-binding protein
MSYSKRMTQWSALLATLLLGVPGAAPAADPGIGNDVVVLGQSAALTGPASSLGVEMREGALAYFSRINAAGGVHGRKIELHSLDDGYEPDRTAANTRKLIDEERVFMLFGYVGTPTSQAALPIFTAAKVPFFGAFTGAELLRTPLNRYVFNMRASYYDETETMVNHLVTSGKRNIAVFYQNDAFGKAGLTGVELAMKRRGLAISATGTVERNTTEVAAAVKSIGAAKPDAIIMVSAYRSCGEFVRQAKKAGMHADFLNVSFVGAKALATDLGSDGYGVVVAQVVPFPWGANTPVVRDYHKAMASVNPQSALSFTSLEGYLAAKTLSEALRRVGRDLSREKLIAELERMREYDLGGFVVGFSPSNHNGSKFVDLTMIGKEGRFVR